MRKGIILTTAALAAAILLSSCASMKLATVRTPLQPSLSATVNGGSLLVSPMKIQLAASRPEFDLRDVTVTAQGQRFTLGGRYLETTDDMDLGSVGVLDTNIFRKAQVDVASLSAHATSRFVELVSGSKDVRILINRDKPDVGELSSRPIIYDFSANPWVGTIDPAGEPLPALFKSVSAGRGAAKTDYVLAVNLTIRSEIYEITQDDTHIQDKYMFASHAPSKGDYYLDLISYATFKLTDANGKVVMDEKSKQAYPVGYTVSRQLYLPVKNRDADAYAKYFRSYDFGASAQAIVDEMVDQLIPVFRPLYQNMNQYVKAEQ